MENKKEMTAPCVSALHMELLSSPSPLAKELQYVDTDTEQSFQKCSNNSITDRNEKFNAFSEKGGGYNG